MPPLCYDERDVQGLGVNPMNTNRLRVFGFSIIMLIVTAVIWERSTSGMTWFLLVGGLAGLGIAIFQKKWPE
jgi:hypothetical protein